MRGYARSETCVRGVDRGEREHDMNQPRPSVVGMTIRNEQGCDILAPQRPISNHKRKDGSRSSHSEQAKSFPWYDFSSSDD